MKSKTLVLIMVATVSICFLFIHPVCASPVAFSDTFDDETKISYKVNTTVVGGDAKLAIVETFNDTFDTDTGWTEVDPNGHIVLDTATDKRVEFNGITMAESAYLYRPCTPITDFVLEFEMNVTSSTYWGCMGIGFADSVGDIKGVSNGLYMERHGDTNFKIIHVTSGAVLESTPDYAVGSFNTTYYFTFTRTGTACELGVYSDAERTTHIPIGPSTTLPISYTDSTPVTFNYLYVISAYNDPSYDGGGESSTGWIDNLVVKQPAVNGTLITTTIDAPSDWYAWDTLTINKTEPGASSIKVSVYDNSTGTPTLISGFDNRTESTIDLSSITAQKLELRYYFTAGSTPLLHDYTVTYTPEVPPTPISMRTELGYYHNGMWRTTDHYYPDETVHLRAYLTDVYGAPLPGASVSMRMVGGERFTVKSVKSGVYEGTLDLADKYDLGWKEVRVYATKSGYYDAHASPRFEIISYPTPTPTPTPYKPPGFEAVIAITGLLVVAHLVGSSKGGGK